MNPIRRSLPASGIRSVFDRARELERSGIRVLHLDVGRPAYALPPGAEEGAEAALEAGMVHYIENRGLPELREAIAMDVADQTGVQFDPARELVVTSGASEALAMIALAFLGPGDEAIVPVPAWNHYDALVRMAGGTVVEQKLSADDGFRIDPDALARLITPNTRLIFLNSPGNPTGAVQPENVLRAVAEIALKHGIMVVADEVYRDFVYEGDQASIVPHMRGSDNLILVNSFSKSYAMTGWRIGYAASNASVSDALNRVHQYLTVCGVPFAQKGAASMLTNPGRKEYMRGLKEEFNRRYRVWSDGLAGEEKFFVKPPGGAFYVFPRVSHKNMTGREFCAYMLEEHHVAMVPGDVFGAAYGQHVRISFGLEESVQVEALSRILGVLHG